MRAEEQVWPMLPHLVALTDLECRVHLGQICHVVLWLSVCERTLRHVHHALVALGRYVETVDFL